MRQTSFAVVLVLYGHLTLLGHFGRGQLAYSHCSLASLLDSLPVSYCKNWSILTYSKIGKTTVSPYCWKLLQSLFLKCPSVIDVLTADATGITCSLFQNEINKEFIDLRKIICMRKFESLTKSQERGLHCMPLLKWNDITTVLSMKGLYFDGLVTL